MQYAALEEKNCDVICIRPIVIGGIDSNYDNLDIFTRERYKISFFTVRDEQITF